MRSLSEQLKTGFLITPFFFILKLILPSGVSAHCPLCVAGAGAGLTLSRILGIDDTITGIWLGSFLGAISFWTETAFVKKPNLKPILRPLIYIAIFASTIWSFYQFNLVVRMSEIFGVHKLTFGIITGGILFYLIDVVDDLLIKNNGRVFFPYQRIIVSLGGVLIYSGLIYYLINYVI